MKKQLQGKIILAKDVRECLMYAELGEVDGGFVYRTDALSPKKQPSALKYPETSILPSSSRWPSP